MAISAVNDKSTIEIYYSGTPSTIRVLCEFWRYPKNDIAMFLHGAFMFLPYNMDKEVEKELDFLSQIVRLR